MNFADLNFRSAAYYINGHKLEVYNARVTSLISDFKVVGEEISNHIF